MEIAIPWRFPRANAAERVLRALTLGPLQSLSIYAPTGTGTTHFLLNDLAPAAVAMGYVVAYVDLDHSVYPELALLQSLTNIASAGHQVINALEGEFHIAQALNGHIDGLTYGGTVGRRALMSVAALLIDECIRDITRTANLLLVIDGVSSFCGSSGMYLARSLRTALAKHFGQVRTVFTATSYEQIGRVFSDAGAPMYSAGHFTVELPLLGHDFAEFICGQFMKSTGRKLNSGQIFNALVHFGSRPASLLRCVLAMVFEPEMTLPAAAELERNRLEVATRLSAATGNYGPLVAFEGFEGSIRQLRMREMPGLFRGITKYHRL